MKRHSPGLTGVIESRLPFCNTRMPASSRYARRSISASGLVFRNQSGNTPVPIDQLSLVMLGPGSSVTHAAVKAMARNNCLLAWVGEDGIRSGATFETEPPSWEAWDAAHPEVRLVAERDGAVVGWAALSPSSARRCYRGVGDVSVYKLLIPK